MSPTNTSWLEQPLSVATRIALFILAVAAVAMCTGCSDSKKVNEAENQVRVERIWSDDGYETVYRFHDEYNATTCYVFHGTISCVEH